MPKKPSKPSGSSEYSPEHRHNVLLEEIQSQLKHMSEGQDGLHEKVDNLSGRLEQVEGKLGQVEIEVAAIKFTLKNDVATKKDIKALTDAFDKRLAAVESR